MGAQAWMDLDEASSWIEQRNADRAERAAVRALLVAAVAEARGRVRSDRPAPAWAADYLDAEAL